MALAAVKAVRVLGHEHTSTTSVLGALLAQTRDLAAGINLVKLEHAHLYLLALVADLLGRRVNLLLLLLGTTTETEHQMQRALLLDVVVAQGAAILKLLAGKDETLLIGRDAYNTKKKVGSSSLPREATGPTFLVLNLGLDGVDAVRGLNLESDGLAREGLDKDLHGQSKALSTKTFKDENDRGHDS